MSNSLFSAKDCEYLDQHYKEKVEKVPPEMDQIVKNFADLCEKIVSDPSIKHLKRPGNKSTTPAKTLVNSLYEYFAPTLLGNEEQVFYNITIDAVGLHMKIDLKRVDKKAGGQGRYVDNYNNSSEAKNIENNSSFSIEKDELDNWSIDDLVDEFIRYTKKNLNNLLVFGKYIGSTICEQIYDNMMNNVIQKLVESNYNLILTGAPGTGKTHLAREIAVSLIGCKEEELNDNGRYGFVQFHPSYDYTDFVEGLRPIQQGKNIVFKRKDGIFKAFCAKAAQDNPDNKYVFVIDEINRGEISKIFGELFFSIDPGYRGELNKDTKISNRVKTQYQNLIDEDNTLVDDVTKADNKTKRYYPFKTGFYVPENVYVIGTMNDIDRSVESMDFAFRRRFAFYEITANKTQDSILGKLTQQNVIDEAKKRMDALNNAIYSEEQKENYNLLEGFTSAYHIGAAYFKKIEKYGKDEWDKLWENHIKGVLFEYLRGIPNATTLLTQLKNVYDLKNADGTSK